MRRRRRGRKSSSSSSTFGHRRRADGRCFLPGSAQDLEAWPKRRLPTGSSLRGWRNDSDSVGRSVGRPTTASGDNAQPMSCASRGLRTGLGDELRVDLLRKHHVVAQTRTKVREKMPEQRESSCECLCVCVCFCFLSLFFSQCFLCFFFFY